MKIITYVLNENGTIPDYVTDGGYFPDATEGASPQDWTLVGVATDEAPHDAFSDVNSLEEYLVSIGGESWTDIDNNPVNLLDSAQSMFDKL